VLQLGREPGEAAAVPGRQSGTQALRAIPPGGTGTRARTILARMI